MNDNPRSPLGALYQNLSSVMFGKGETLTLTLVALLARGHLLIDDVPGVGKTTLARALAQSIGGSFKRLQCTPDLLPADITGVSIFDHAKRSFEFAPGPVFTNILLADEINRAPPRAQSGLLECMAEGQVSVDGHTHALPAVFMVMATQNPVEFHGTYPLPEAQLDRFMLRVRIGYPAADAELKMLASQRHGHPLDALLPVAGLEDIARMQRAVEDMRVADDVARYALALVDATRKHPGLALGASPRATLALVRAAQALAYATGVDFVSPQHVKRIAPAVLAHRLVARAGSNAGTAAEAVVGEVLAQVAVPA